MTDTADWTTLSSNAIAQTIAPELSAQDCDAFDYRWQFVQLPVRALLEALSQEALEIFGNDLDGDPDGAKQAPIIALRAGGPLDLVAGSAQIRSAIHTGQASLSALLGTRAPHTFAASDPALSPDQGAGEERTYQERVDNWMLTCFGEAISMNPRERNMRFLEEALELVQAAGMTRAEVDTLASYVFDRPKGELSQELGGASVCLAALATAHGADLGHAAETELGRIWPKSEKIRIKHGAKPANIRG